MVRDGCMLCPRNCGADRKSGEVGYCRVDARLKLARAALHFGEEPCISGEKGSGTVFFSGCSLGCVFCQNQEISRGQTGKVITVERLAEIFLEQEARGAHNLNLVTPSHYTPAVAAALRLAKAAGLSLPVIWNSSAYEKTETLRSLEGLVDVYLPDMKYRSARIADRYAKAADYFSMACDALTEMHRQQPRPEFDEAGLLRKGCLVRILLLPGCLEDAKQLLAYLFKKYGSSVYFSLMAQYTPMGDLRAYPEINRRLKETEYEEWLDYAVSLGVEQAFVQELDSADPAFVPKFDGSGV